MSPLYEHYTLNLNKSFPHGDRYFQGCVEVAPIKLQTQIISKMQILECISMNDYRKAALYRLTSHVMYDIIAGLS